MKTSYEIINQENDRRVTRLVTIEGDAPGLGLCQQYPMVIEYTQHPVEMAADIQTILDKCGFTEASLDITDLRDLLRTELISMDNWDRWVIGMEIPQDMVEIQRRVAEYLLQN